MKKIKRIFSFIIPIIFCSLSFCTTSNNNFINNYMSNYPDLLNIIIKYPDDLLLLNNPPKTFNKKDNVIIVTGYLDCTPCSIRLKKIGRFVDKYPNINLIYITTGQKSKYNLRQIQENYYSFSIYYDSSASFIRLNNLYNYDRSFFLVNNKKKIVLVGSPIDNPILQKYYLELIKE